MDRRFLHHPVGHDRHVPWKMHRDVIGKAKTATVSMEGNWWFVSISVEQEVEEPTRRSGPAIGIDMGVATPIALSNGQTLDLPKLCNRQRRRLKALGQSLSRKKKGSRNRERARRKLAHYQAHLARRRLDMAHRAAAIVARNYAHVAMEHLKLRNMTASAAGTVEEPGRNVRAKSGLNRVLLDVAPFQFRTVLQDKLERSGGTLTLVDPKNTSRTCSACGHVAAENRESQAVFSCVSCGHTAHADVNAAINIKNRAFGTGTGGPPGMACGSNRTGGRKQERSAISLAA